MTDHDEPPGDQGDVRSDVVQAVFDALEFRDAAGARWQATSCGELTGLVSAYTDVPDDYWATESGEQSSRTTPS